MIKLVFIIRSLDCGGAERQLLTLANALDRKYFEPTIVTFYSGGPNERHVSDKVRLISLNKSGRWDAIGFLVRLVRELRRLRPDVIHSYADIPNILSLLVKHFTGRPAIVWGSRMAFHDVASYDWLHRVAFQLERKLARFPDRIIVNSHAGHRCLRARGYQAARLVTINNGFDSEHFQPNPEARRRIRSEWGLAPDQIVIGLVARMDPIKDHPTFLRAAALVKGACPNVRFVCIGNGPESYRQALLRLVDQLGLGDRITWTGLQTDMADIYNAIDVNVLSSISEGCPNVVGEAMACGVPCVVTDVGDLASLVGDTGFICPPQNPEALAANLIKCIEADRVSLGINARRRIEKSWNVGRLVDRTERVLAAAVRTANATCPQPSERELETESGTFRFSAEP